MWAWLGIVAAVAACVAVFVSGQHEQQQRRIPAVVSATVASRAGNGDLKPVGPVSVSPVEANRLIAGLNALPHERSGDTGCGEDTGAAYLIRFVAVHGSPIDVSLAAGGCMGVQVSSAGRDWGWVRWDPNATVRSEVAKDLR